MAKNKKKAPAENGGSRSQQRVVRATWEYSHYRAILRRNGKPFAIVTPDGKNALIPLDAFLLLKALNGGSNAEVCGGNPSASPTGSHS